jgi:DNA-directed RNA polymerase specialized sigma24 family protein
MADYVEYVSARLPALHRAAYLLCGDAHRADDIVQATITTLSVNWRRASRADNLDGYSTAAAQS